jgi:hypothetical protein
VWPRKENDKGSPLLLLLLFVALDQLIGLQLFLKRLLDHTTLPRAAIRRLDANRRSVHLDLKL